MFREFSWPEDVFKSLTVFPERFDVERAHLQPFGVRAASADFWNRESPAYGVSFGWARRNLNALFDATEHGLALSSDSFEAGIVVSVVCGFLEEDPNPSELKYLLATWG